MQHTFQQAHVDRRSNFETDSVDDLAPRNVIRMSPASSILPPLLIAVAVFAVYSRSTTGPFLFDDIGSIVENVTIRSVWPLSASLWAPQDVPTAGRPAVNLSFALNYAAGQLSVVGYHFTNVVIHCLNAAILFAFARRTLTQSRWGRQQPGLVWGAAIAIAALWSLHPMQTETVTYITQRTELLMAFFFLATMFAACREWDADSRMAKTVWGWICVGSCALGMASKEVMVVAPLMVALYDLSMMKLPIVRLVKRRWMLYLGLAATWGILAALMATDPRGRSVGFGLSIAPLDYLTTQFWAITHYLWLTVWPFGLCGDYGIVVVTKIGSWLPCFLLLFFLSAVTAWAWFHWRNLAFLGVWFFLLLAPTSSIVPIVSEPVAERRMYLPLAAVAVVVVLGAIAFAHHRPFGANAESRVLPSLRRRVLVILVLALSVAYSWATLTRNEVYQSELAFWNDVVQKRPDNSRGFANLGIIYVREHHSELGKASFQRAIELAPTNADAHYNLGVWYADHGNIVEAMTHYDHAIAANPRMAKAHSNLGKIYADVGHVSEAAIHYNRALEINPSLVNALYSRGLLYSSQQRWEEAIRDFQTAISVDPKMSVAIFQLGNVYLAQKQWGQAIEKYRSAIRLDPELGGAYLNLGTALARSKEFREAVDWIEQAVKLEPRNSDAFSNLGFCYASLGQAEEAIAAYKQCLAIQPKDAQAWYRLGKIYANDGKSDDARQCFERVLQLDPNSAEAQAMLKQL